MLGDSLIVFGSLVIFLAPTTLVLDRPGAADRGEYRQAAGIVAPNVMQVSFDVRFRR